MQRRLRAGEYSTFESFDHDILRILDINAWYAGPDTWMAALVDSVRALYRELKITACGLFEVLTDTPLPEEYKAALIDSQLAAEERAASRLAEPEVMRCVCGFPFAESRGLRQSLIQCERCFVWQHAYCVRLGQGLEALSEGETYLCEVS